MPSLATGGPRGDEDRHPLAWYSEVMRGETDTPSIGNATDGAAHSNLPSAGDSCRPVETPESGRIRRLAMTNPAHETGYGRPIELTCSRLALHAKARATGG